MGRLTRTILTMIIAVFMVVTNMLTPNTRAVTTVNADTGDIPDHAKSISDNGDGTYQLELSVTGDASTETSITGRVNVLVVYDTSYSMTYTNGSARQAPQAEYALRQFTEALFAHQNPDDPTNIQMSLVTFASSARTQVNWTSTATNITNLLSNNGRNGSERSAWYAWNNDYNGMYTNWQAAMDEAYSQVQAADGDETFVIFMTDGMPTQRNNTGYNQNQALQHYRAAQPNAYNIQNYDTVNKRVDAANSNVSYYGIYAFGREADYLDDLVYYAHNGNERAQQGTGTVATPYYYNASNASELNVAINEIFGQITEALGVSSVVVEDGTTNNVATSTGRIELLDVETDSFEYWISIPVTGNRFTRIDSEGNEVVYTISGSAPNYTVSWSGGTVTVEEGSISSGQFKYKWTERTALYDFNPPAATYVNGEVDWDLTPVKTLLDGVTYSVTFNVYPSQTTYNLIADLKNGSKTWESLDPAIQKYLVKTGENSYSLLTNTEAQIRWKDTREDNPRERTDAYNELDPVKTDAQEMDIEKIWKGSYRTDEGLEEQLPMTMHILRNGEEYETIDLDYAGGYKGSKFIATGLMRVNEAAGTVQVLDTGYDYELKEDENLSYHWELIADVLHPMVINGTLVNLKVVEPEDIPAGMPADAQYWTDGTTKYYRFENNGKMEVFTASESSSALSATNVRRSNLNLTKVVNGDNAPDEFFTFTMTLGNPENAKEDFYFSVWNGGYVVPQEYPADQWGGDSAQVPVAGFTVDGADPEMNTDNKYTGYFVASPGTAVTVTLKNGWNLRFTNVLTGTTYEINEGTLPTSFQFVSSDLKVTEIKAKSEDPEKDITSGSAAPVKDGTKISGEIDQGNANFTITYTNEYIPAVVAPQVTKKVTGANAKEAFEFEITAGDDATETAITDGLIEMPSSTTVSTAANITDGGEETVTFGDITFFRAGTYTFTIAETNTPAPAGWTYANTDADKKTVTVTVSAGANNKLTAVVSPEAPVEFENKYAPLPAKATIKINKIIKSLNPALDGNETFTFVIASEDGPLPENKTKTITVAAANEDGVEVAFDEIEFDTPGTYTYTVTEVIDNLDGGYIVTGSPATFEVVVEDDEKDGQMDATVTPETADITNEYPTVDVPVTKTWDDSEFYVDGKPVDGYTRPDIVIVLKADDVEIDRYTMKAEDVSDADPNKWLHTFEKLPKYKNHSTESEIVYTIEEILPEGFINEQTDYEVINTPVRSEEDVTPLELIIKKTDELTGEIIGTGAVFELTGGDLTEAKTYTTGTDGQVVIKFEKEGEYTLTETQAPVGYKSEPLPSYTIVVDKEFIRVEINEKGDLWTWFYQLIFGQTPAEFEDGVLTVPNPPTEIDIDTKKIWDDAQNQDRVRPESVTYQLYKTVNGTDTKVEGKTVTLTGDMKADEWTTGGKFTALPAYENGYKVTYWIVELTGSGAEVADGGKLDDNYTAAYSANKLEVTNSYNPEETAITVVKVWDDEEFMEQADKGYVRPTEVEVTLHADGGDVTQEGIVPVQILNEENKWTYTWSGLNKKKDGVDIVYTVTEKPVDGYTTEITPEEGTSYTITNTPGKEEVLNPTELKVVKFDAITGNVIGTGAEFRLTSELLDAPIVKTTDENGEAVFTFEKDGVYTLTETKAPEGYKTDELPSYTITIDKELIEVKLKEDKSLWQWIYDLFVKSVEDRAEYNAEDQILYVPNPPTEIDIDTKKIWDDAQNQDRVRPESVTYQLYKTVNGKDTKVEEKTVTLTGDETADEWTTGGTFTGLPAYEDGYEITYWIVELTASGAEVAEGGKLDDNYTAAYSANKLEVTNSYSPETTEVPFKKVWNDADDTLGVRPTEITVWLMDGINQLNEQIVTKDMNWEYTFTTDADGNPLPKNRDGQPINYTVTEKEVRPYEGAVIGIDDDGRFIIENRLEIPPVKDVFEEGKLDTSIDGQPVAIGDKLTYTINYKNTTGAEAEVTITDKIPEHTTFENADNGGTFADGTVTWNLTVADKSEITVSFTVTVDDYQGAVLPNTAVVRVGENDSETNEVVNYVPTDPVKDVFYTSAPTVSIDGEQVQRGDELLYKIDYKNTTGDKTTVTVTDTIPEHTTFVSADNDGSYDDATRTITWTGIEVENGEGLTVSFIVTVDDDVNGEVLVNKARVEDGVNDKDTNEVTNPTPTQPEKDVFTEGDTTTSIDGKPVKVGDNLTYQIKYTNTTGKDATVTITDEIPEFTEFVSADNGGTFADSKVTWTLDVAKDAGITVSFVVTVTEEAAGEKLLNDAEVQEGQNKYTTNEVVNYVPTDPVKDVFYTSAPTVSIDGEQVQRGEKLLYKIDYVNTTGATTTVTITDEIPEHTTFVSADNGGTYDDATRTVTWTGIQVENDNSLTVSFIVTVDDDVNGEVLVNDADVDDGVNKSKTNEVTNPTPTDPEKDVFTEGDTTTSIDGKPVNVGDNLTYQIKYKNTTGKDATVTITDEIPAFTEFVSADNNGTFADGKVTWTLDVANGEEIIVSFVVTVTEEAEGEKLLNDAEVQEGENKYTTNEVVNYVPTDPVKDVFYTSDPTVSIDGEQVQRGEELLYKIDYVNTTGDKTTVTVTDTIPEHTTFVSADNGGTYDDATRTITWSGIEVAYEDSLTVSFVVTVDDDVNGEKLINKARVEDGVNDKDTNEVINPTPTQPEKDVFTEGGTTTSIDGKPVKVGDNLTYQIKYKNTTGKDATVTITDEIPEFTEFVSADNGGTFADSKVTWTLDVANDAEITVSFVVTVTEEAEGEKLLNDAEVQEGENKYTTNEVVNYVPTDPVKDVFYTSDPTVSIDGEQVQRGEELLYKIDYVNTTGDKTTVTVTDTIPEHTTFVSADNGGTYDDATRTITWSGIEVAYEDSLTVSFVVTVDDDVNGEKLINKARVEDGVNDKDTNEVINPTPTQPEKDVFTPADTTTSIDGRKAEPGDELLYKITYKNTTGKDADVTIEDAIPEYTTYVEGSADYNGTFADNKVTWTLNVKNDEEVTVSFKVKVNDDAVSEPVYNDAIVREGKNEYTTNEVVNTIPTPPVKDVFYSDDLTTSIDGEQVKAGEQLTYVITYTNTTGEKEPADVTITDVLPQYTSFVEATEGGTYDEATNTVTWTLVVNNGETVNVAFSVKVDDDAEDVKIPNTAKVRKGENEYTTNEVVNYVPKDPVKDVFKPADTATSIDGNKVEPGEELLYQITYKNATGKEAEVTIEDAIPQFTTYVEGSADNGGVYADGKITWTMTLAYEEEVTVSFKVKVNEDTAGEEVVNDALVREGENEYTTNEVVNSIPTPPTKDVFYSDDLTTSIDGKQVKPGEQLTYVITYTNTTGEKEPADVTITDVLPQYTSFVEATEGGTYDEATNTVTWNLVVNNGETVKVAFSVKVDDDADGVRIPNTAKVRKGENEYTTNEVVNYVPGEPVKEVFKSSDTTTSIDGKTVQPGDELTYKISYTNATGKEAEVTIEDAIPQFTTYVEGSADNGGVYADGKITWTLTVPYEGSVTVSFKVTVNADSEGEKVVNDAIVREGENEYTTNEVVNTIPTPPVKDVFRPEDTTVSIDGKEVKSGDHLMYAITYKNTTGADADVMITDKIPAHTTFVNAQNDGTFADGTVTWNLKVKDGESVTVTFVVKVDNVTQAVEIPNTAHVIDGANEYDTNEVINTVPYVPKTGDESDYRAFRMHCFTLAGSLMVFLAALIIMIINRKKEEEFFAKK